MNEIDQLKKENLRLKYELDKDCTKYLINRIELLEERVRKLENYKIRKEEDEARKRRIKLNMKMQKRWNE